jgi:hypothetical protein
MVDVVAWALRFLRLQPATDHIRDLLRARGYGGVGRNQ